MTSLIGPNGDTGHRPMTMRWPVVVPKAAISPSNSQRAGASDHRCRKGATESMIPGSTYRCGPDWISTGEEFRLIDTVEVEDQGEVLAYTFEDLMRYHGPGSPGGVAHALKVMQRALPLLERDGLPQRREIEVQTAFAGPGARDAFEMATRAVTEGRYVVDDALARPELGATRERFIFQLNYRARTVTVVLREGYVGEEFIALARMPQRTESQENRLTVLKREMAQLLLATPAAEVYDVDAAG
jgi:hypothetical protein